MLPKPRRFRWAGEPPDVNCWGLSQVRRDARRRSARRLGEPKVENLGRTVRRNDAVGWFEIPVDQTGTVRGLKTQGNLTSDAERFVEFDRPRGGRRRVRLAGASKVGPPAGMITAGFRKTS